MKPLLMKLSGWGPYKEEQMIDFSKLQERGIFLITGATGAGKTTVFDAITYALYGTVSGNTREKDSLRSDFSDETTKTYVELIMTHGTQTYTLYRMPEYMRPKKIKTKKEEYIKEAEKAILTMPDGSVIEGSSEVTKKVEEILRMDCRQFKQISMIAQGEFTKLLTANQKEKTELFRELFHLYFYEKFVQKLKGKAFDLAGKIKTFRDKMEEIVDQTELTGEEWGQLKQNKPYAFETILEFLEKEEMIQKEQQLILEEKIQVTEAEVTTLLQKMEDGKHRNQLWIQKEKAEADYQQHLLLAEDNNTKIEMLTGAKKAQMLQVFEVALQTTKEQAEEIRKKVGKYQQECRLLEEYQKKTQDIFERRVLLAELFKTIEDFGKVNSVLLEKEQKLQEKQNQLEQSQLEYENWETEVGRKREAYQKAESRYRRAMVGIVAEMLIEGEPCPVCGSKEHPKIASVAEGTIREEELQLQKEELEKINEKLMESYSKTITIKEETKTQKNVVEEMKQQTANQRDQICEQVTKLQEILPRIEHQLSYRLEPFLETKSQYANQPSTMQATLQLKELVEKRTIKNAERDEKEKLLTMLQEEARVWNERTTQATQELDQKKQEQHYRTEEAYESDRKAISKIEELSLQIEAYETKRMLLEDSKKRADEAVVGKEAVLLEELAEQTREVQKIKQGYEEQKQQIMILLAQIQRASLSMKEKLEKNRKLEKEYGIIGDLERISAGKNPKKLIFEQYVLSGYFDAVLGAANLRFSQMTTGRYELFRAEGIRDGRKRDSLEIEVMDYYTGKKRSVKTLSGGELFKASLSLALGMSDRIQSENGGILIETLFVDEGFGSLDEQSLDQACQTLMSLAEKDKLIGIISHVPELKEKISNQIVVEKTNAGSWIKVLQE